MIRRRSTGPPDQGSLIAPPLRNLGWRTAPLLRGLGQHGIICWKHNWPDCPEGLEVIELSRVVKGSGHL